jgi:hypothetical protein
MLFHLQGEFGPLERLQVLSFEHVIDGHQAQQQKQQQEGVHLRSNQRAV